MFHPARRTRRHARPRRGYALVLFVVFMMIFVSMAGLVIGLGFVRLSQQQMRSATDAAALEGLRWRDEIPEELANTVQGCGPTDVEDEMWRDCARRYLASQIAKRVLSDPTGQTTTRGAGPILAIEDSEGSVLLSGEFGEFTASQTLSLAEPRSYEAVLELNLGNEMHGDMVAGSYGFNEGYDDGTLSQEELARDEVSTYARRDFVPDPVNDDAFLVRMRRTDGSNLLDLQGGTSSRGPEVPLLFGRWMTFKSGVSVRSTSIAAVGQGVDGRPLGSVMQVGQADTGSNVRGVAPFVLELDFWNDPDNWNIGPDAATASVMTSGADIIFPSEMGEMGVDQTVGKAILPPPGSLSVGDVVTFATSPPNPNDGRPEVYVPIVEDVDQSTVEILGFAYVEFTGSALVRPAQNGMLKTHIAADNVRLIPSKGVLDSFRENPEGLQDLLNRHLAVERPLSHPVLVNRHLGPN